MNSSQTMTSLLPPFSVGPSAVQKHAPIESGPAEGGLSRSAPLPFAGARPARDEMVVEVEDGDVDELALVAPKQGGAGGAPIDHHPHARTSHEGDRAPPPAQAHPVEVTRTNAKEQREKDERERQRIVDNVLRRAQAAKLARTFRARLELAAFKAERGWQDATLNEIEPHVEAEDAKRRDMHRREQYELQQQRQHQHHQQQQQYARPAEGLMGPPTTTLKRQRGGSLANASMANTTMYDQQVYNPPAPYAASPYPPPTASTSALQPPAQLRHTNAHFPPPLPPSEAHRQKRRQTIAAESSLPTFRTGSSGTVSPPPRRPSSAGSPRSRTSSARQSSANGSAPTPSASSSSKQLSSSDPTFSSFVDAASVLSGLSRGPSETSVLGTSDSEPSRPPSTNPFQQPPPPRPQTPPTMARDDKGAIVAMNENDTAGAAELMLFLAASPSPAQVRSGTAGLQLGPGEALKGRRLFSGGTDDGAASLSESARSVFGGPMMQNGSNGGGPFVGSPGPPGVPSYSDYGASSGGPAYLPELDHSSASSSTSFLAPSLTSSAPRTHHSSASSSLSSAPAMNGSTIGAPTTPSRDRSSGSWESYLNVSPSPQRTTQPFSMPLTSLSPTSLPLGRSQGAGW